MLHIRQALLEQTLAHLNREAPLEGVGLWLGRDGRVALVVALPNIDSQPERGYTAEPKALVAAVLQAQQQGLELLAIYHSHPIGPAVPSERDRNQAFWRVPYVIVGLAPHSLRAWLLPQTEEVPIGVED